VTVVYEKAFDANEWFTIGSLLLLNILIWITPKRFSLLEGMGHYVFGIFISMFFDHTISVKPWDFYDVNDSSAYQVTDFMSYLMFGPYSYFFIYFYLKFRIAGFMNILYILVWACSALFMEWVGIQVGLFHYDKGYKMYWSFPIYLSILSIQMIYYHIIRMKQAT
jgi:hypothetical protein